VKRPNAKALAEALDLIAARLRLRYEGRAPSRVAADVIGVLTKSSHMARPDHYFITSVMPDRLLTMAERPWSPEMAVPKRQYVGAYKQAWEMLGLNDPAYRAKVQMHRAPGDQIVMTLSPEGIVSLNNPSSFTYSGSSNK
jgi:hypothetical protein